MSADREARRSPIYALLLLVALAVVLAGIFPFRQIIAQQRQVDLTERKYEALVAENESLEENIRVLETPQEIERIAREQYGLVRPGEESYVAVIPPGDHAPERAPDVLVVAAQDDRGFWNKVWDFLTGRDLVPDE